MANANRITQWDRDLAEQKRLEADAEREHDEDFADVVEALKKLDVDPRRLRDYLADLS